MSVQIKIMGVGLKLVNRLILLLILEMMSQQHGDFLLGGQIQELTNTYSHSRALP
jgi:hypothetical protein